MDRVAFLLASGERIGALLNPETLVMRRTAGLRPRRALGGAVAGGGPMDDPLLFTGGGTTEMLLELLFDVSLLGSSIQTEDVRDLTQPLWRLAENSEMEGGFARPRPRASSGASASTSRAWSPPSPSAWSTSPPRARPAARG